MGDRVKRGRLETPYKEDPLTRAGVACGDRAQRGRVATPLLRNVCPPPRRCTCTGRPTERRRPHTGVATLPLWARVGLSPLGLKPTLLFVGGLKTAPTSGRLGALPLEPRVCAGARKAPEHPSLVPVESISLKPAKPRCAGLLRRRERLAGLSSDRQERPSTPLRGFPGAAAPVTGWPVEEAALTRPRSIPAPRA